MGHFNTTFLLIFLLLLNQSCEDESVQNPSFNNTAGTLPLLQGDNRLGMIVGFNPSNPPITIDSINARWQEALNGGMSVARLQIDWPELEENEDQYNKEVLREQLEAMSSQGLQTFLTISAYDSDGSVVPDYLEGLTFDNEIVTNRFNKLMDWVIPMLVDYKGWAIAISNEPDNFFEENESLADEILFFSKRVTPHIHNINEKMAVTITMNVGNLVHSENLMQQIGNELDVSCFNIYGSGLFPLNTPYTENEIKELIGKTLAFAGSKNVIYQEVGMHSETDMLNSSEEIQSTFFNVFFQEMKQEERMKAAFVFQLVDWSPEVIELFNSLYEPDVPQSFIDQYGAVLGSIGLIHYKDGKSRKAWNDFVIWLEEFN